MSIENILFIISKFNSNLYSLRIILIFYIFLSNYIIPVNTLKMSEIMQVKKLSEFAILPVRGSKYAAGFDLAAAYDTIVPSRGKTIVKTDLAIAIPLGTYARIAPRSGLAVKNFIDTGAGVVDYDYRGSVGVVLFNHSEQDFEIKRGDRVAQLILEKISMADIVEVDELDDTERGERGYGSTGVSGEVKKPKIDE